MAYPVYAKTATIAFVPVGSSSMQYLLYEAVRTIGDCGVYKKTNGIFMNAKGKVIIETMLNQWKKGQIINCN